MIWLDVILLSPLLWGAYTGFKKGLVAQILGIISLVAGVWIGTHFQDLIEPFIVEKIQEKYLSTLSFIILFFATIITGAIVTKIIEKFINFVQLKLLNKIAGVVLGMIKILSFLVIIIFILESWDTQSFILEKTTKNSSMVYPILENIGDLILPTINHSNILDQLPNTNKVII